MPRDNRGISFLVILLCVVILLAGVVGAIVGWQHARKTAAHVGGSTTSVMSPEQRAYLAALDFNDLHMSAAENFLGGTVTYLDGKVINKGGKTLHRVDIELNFVDALNQVVLRETARPLTKSASPLPPGEVRGFRVVFEHLPADWNQAPPAIKPIYVEF